MNARPRILLAAIGVSTMLAGFTIGYAFGLQHSLRRSLAGKDHHGI